MHVREHDPDGEHVRPICTFAPGENGRWVCTKCKIPTHRAFTDPPLRNCAIGGPGFALHLTLASYGIRPRKSCKCKEYAAQMDAWGISGCQERREEIADWLLDSLNLPDDGTEDASNVSGRLLKMIGRNSPRFVQRLAALWLVDEAIARAESSSP